LIINTIKAVSRDRKMECRIETCSLKRKEIYNLFTSRGTIVSQKEHTCMG
jgi:hypothetical protein